MLRSQESFTRLFRNSTFTVCVPSDSPVFAMLMCLAVPGALAPADAVVLVELARPRRWHNPSPIPHSEDNSMNTIADRTCF